MDGLFLEEYKRVARDLGATERVDVIRLEGSPHLQLNGNCTTRFAAHVQDLDAVAIVQALQAASTGVETMDFSYNFLGNRAATTLAEFIRKDSALNALNLAFNEITSAGGRALAQALVINKSITHLNLQVGPCYGGGGRGGSVVCVCGAGDRTRDAVRSLFCRLRAKDVWVRGGGCPL